jgi:hypothetical protein
VHFLDLASAVEKLRWAEKEWRELDQELAASANSDASSQEEVEEDEESDADDDAELIAARR